MLKFLARNIDITDVFKAVILATLKSYKTKALTKAYSLILDNLDDSHDLTFEMIQRACVRKLCCSHARGADRSPERRPATPHRAYKDKDLRRPKDFSQAKPDDVSAFLVNFLAQRGIKARTVLKENDLPPDDLHDAFALKALYEAAAPYLPETIVTDTDSAATDRWSDSQASSASVSSP